MFTVIAHISLVLVDARHSPPFNNTSNALRVLIVVRRSFSNIVFIVKLLRSVVLVLVYSKELYNRSYILDVSSFYQTFKQNFGE